MGIIYFEICAVPLFLIILFVCHSRRMTRGNANQLFLALVLFSLFSTLADIGAEAACGTLPLSAARIVLCTVSINIYLILRNATNAILLLFLLYLTQTSFLIRKPWVKFAFALPYVCILGMLAQNYFTHNAFTITAEVGYARGPLMMAFYGVALVYGLVGLAYCVYCRRYLPGNKWSALLSIYVLAHLAVLIQFFYPKLLVEMFCTALGEMLIMISIMRPEERMDSDVGTLSWAAYQTDIRNILLSGEHVRIVVIQIPNCREIRSFLGDHKYIGYLSEITAGIRAVRWKQQGRIELYFEWPGTFYLITDPDEDDGAAAPDRLLARTGERIQRFSDMGVRFEPLVCLIRVPEDLRKAEDIFSLGHKFPKMGPGRQGLFLADEIVHSRAFDIEAHIEEILDRAIRENHIVMYYQPIHDVRGGGFRSAEALARIVDPEYGLISPAVFIPAAETEGFIIPVGDAVLEQVFRFISEHDPDALGLSRVEINLSVAQCMESNLPEKILALQRKYNVDPRRINLEITETTFENISETMLENVNELTRMGYSFALDDYGIGYSSIQRVIHLPLKLIKIDKSMLDEISSEEGRTILAYTVRMMQSIGKQLVAEGAETREVVGLLRDMGCDYIQGYYFSRPLPAEEFIRFMKEQNSRV